MYTNFFIEIESAQMNTVNILHTESVEKRTSVHFCALVSKENLFLQVVYFRGLSLFLVLGGAPKP